MIKYFCDRCLKQITLGDDYVLSKNQILKVAVEDYGYDDEKMNKIICQTCYEKLTLFMKIREDYKFFPEGVNS